MAELQFTPEQIELCKKNCIYVTVKDYTGIEFLEKIVRPLVKKHRPDLLRMNPFQAYLGARSRTPRSPQTSYATTSTRS